MSADADKSSKTELPTEKKKKDAFDEGQFAKSPEAGVVAVLIAAFVILVFSAKDKALNIANHAASIFSSLSEVEINVVSAAYILSQTGQLIFSILIPILFACTIASIIAGGLQSGFRLTPKVIELKFEKLNPVQGFKKVFSIKSLVQAGLDALKFIALAFILYGALTKITSDPIFHSPVPPSHLSEFILETFLTMLARLILALGAIAIIHYLYQRHQTTKDLMMTKQEVKDEFKQSQGDPTVKSAQKRAALRILQKQMMDDIPTADVVVTNPTHYAVALKYERGEDAAPIVIAKGQNLFAQKIKSIAGKHDVPVVENKPVARLLFRIGKVGHTIPAELYQIVAEILAHVYQTHRYYFHRLKSRRLEKSLHG